MELTPTVYAVDDDPLARSAIRQSAHSLNFRCEEYASGREFLDAVDLARPGCVVLENGLPGLSGLEVQLGLAAGSSTLPVVFVTRPMTVAAAVQAMRAGAMHVLEKPAREVELWSAIQEAIDLNYRRRQVDQGRRRSQDRLARLTEKEQTMLAAILAGASKEQMASQFGTTRKTIEARRAALMKKLHAGSLAELVRLVQASENGDEAPGRQRA